MILIELSPIMSRSRGLLLGHLKFQNLMNYRCHNIIFKNGPNVLKIEERIRSKINMNNPVKVCFSYKMEHH